MKTSIADNGKRTRGRPTTGIRAPIGVRLYPEMEAALDDWIASKPEPRPSRPEAIRQLVKLGIEANPPAPTLDEQIARQEEKIARRLPTKQSPKKGMAVLRKGLAENDLRKLVEKKSQE